MSQGILTSADNTALNAEKVSVREGEIMRTSVEVVRAAQLTWADTLRVTVDNNGQTKLASFGRWDFIVRYYDSDGTYYAKWLPNINGTPGDNEWQMVRIGLNGPTEYFEPGILNPQEDMVILAKLNPPPGDGTTGEVIVATPNGIKDSIYFFNPGYTLLVPHAENTTIAGTRYYELAEAAPDDGTAMTETTDLFTEGEVGRKILKNENDSSRLARHVFSLTGISEIPSANWTVYYRCRTFDFQGINDNEISFNLDVLIRKADGTVRTTLATKAARAYLETDEVDTWVTKSANYNFPGYTVVDDSDYLEIVYYGETQGDGPGHDGYMQIRIDDSNLDEADQTRIEA
ncbi:MAG: hypothetical protein A2144_09320 [Chloroflexi bacterium RBG_16_50_9]|nr:MAG: hypothetical protein A2144_09320 [Chloroflexi bacterium RBG_16_50_9]